MHRGSRLSVPINEPFMSRGSRSWKNRSSYRTASRTHAASPEGLSCFSKFFSFKWYLPVPRQTLFLFVWVLLAVYRHLLLGFISCGWNRCCGACPWYTICHASLQKLQNQSGHISGNQCCVLRGGRIHEEKILRRGIFIGDDKSGGSLNTGGSVCICSLRLLIVTLDF